MMMVVHIAHSQPIQNDCLEFNSIQFFLDIVWLEIARCVENTSQNEYSTKKKNHFRPPNKSYFVLQTRATRFQFSFVFFFICPI